MKRISIVGAAGVPAAYGGFETLADNLVDFASRSELPVSLTVYCSGKSGVKKYNNATLRYIPISPNGIWSIFYDIFSLFSSLFRRDDVVLLLGVSGAIALPVFKLISRTRIVTNIDGIEWKREKWSGIARFFLRISEYFAVRFSDEIIADNPGIAEHVSLQYGVSSNVIAYGGDHAFYVDAIPPHFALPDGYVLALCRIEPENNVEMILEGFSRCPELNLVFVGNWDSSSFGLEMKQRYLQYPNLRLIEPIYDVKILKSIRETALAYVHGHSAGGTNPSLVEMMHFGIPVLAYDCVFNRYTTGDAALFFRNGEQLVTLLRRLDQGRALVVGGTMQRIAREKYTWESVGRAYFELLL